MGMRVCQRFFAYCQEKMVGIEGSRELLKVGGHATRDFARAYPARFQVMNKLQLQPSDEDAMELIKLSMVIFQRVFKNYSFNENQFIDAMRIINSAISGFINLEQSGMFTLNRSSDISFEVMLDVLVSAIESTKILGC
jgi:Tetracyclin repressor-like, C-terminal domain